MHYKATHTKSMFLSMALTASVLAATVFTGVSAREVSAEAVYDYSQYQTDGPYTFTLADLGNQVETHTELQLQYLASDYTDIPAEADGLTELSYPQPVTLSWEASSEDAGEIAEYCVELSLTDDFSDCVSYTTTEPSLDVSNLFIGSEYYWRVKAADDEGNIWCSDTASFATTDIAPRMIYIDGVHNARDFGGKTTLDGKKVKQGLLYRSGQFNAYVSGKLNVTEAGLETLHDVLHLKTEIDLRFAEDDGKGVTESPVEDAGYHFFCMKYNTFKCEQFLDDHADKLRDIFALLADENTYPADLHCIIGTDRTGSVCMLINGVLGLSDEDIYRDYMLSNFSEVKGPREMSEVEKIMVPVYACEGDTLSAKICNYLSGIGVTEETMQAIRDIMLEEAA